MTPARFCRILLAVGLGCLALWRVWEHFYLNDEMEREDWIGVGVVSVIVCILVAE